MGDMPAVAACAEIKYKDLSLRYVPSGDPKADKLGLSYGRAYLQKIIQLQFDLPAQATPVMSALMQQLVRPSPKAMPPQLEPRGIRQLCDIEGTRAAIDEEINTQVTSGEKDFTAVEKAVTDKLKNFPDSLMLEALLRERIQLHLSDDSELMREAQAEVMNYVEPYPRHAKRLLNRLRLLIFIAHERGMFGGDPYLSPRHIGKWAVLCERWPELAQSLSSKPELMVRLEQEDQYGAAINDIAPFYATDLVLKKFCLAGGDIKLASLTSRIVHFAPASHISP
jgi:hypothetical protein